jgi:hypothetical protein
MTFRPQKVKNSMAHTIFLNLRFHSTELDFVAKLLLLFQILINFTMTLVVQYLPLRHSTRETMTEDKPAEYLTI